jgi:outer membrane lipoprotein carrier protein
VLSLFAFPFAKDREASELVARMEARYRSAKTLEATFLERYAENNRVVKSESGTAYFRRPGKMRWEYEAPERDLFLVDGKTAWFYVPADHTATRVPAKQSTDFRTPMALLAGEMKVSRVCSDVKVSGSERPEREGNVVLECRVRGEKESESKSAANASSTPGANSDQVFFEVVPETGELARILIRQSDGIEIEFRFKNWEFDPPLPAGMFRFTPPVGVAIVNGEPGSGETSEK